MAVDDNGPSGGKVRKRVRRKPDRVYAPKADYQLALAAIEHHILYDEDGVIAINKPAGLPVHRSTGSGKSVDDWLPALARGPLRLPAIMHRLDQDTAGVLLLARTQEARRRLQAAFEHGGIEKKYVALVAAVPGASALAPSGHIDAPLLKVSSAEQGWHMQVDPAGDSAQTNWDVQTGNAGKQVAVLVLTPRTGRTHQLRAHCAHMGWPILGDDVYGNSLRAALDGHRPQGLCLWAWQLTFPSSDGSRINIASPFPGHMIDAISAHFPAGQTRAILSQLTA